MGLVPTLDKKATIKKVREFFSEDEYYPLLTRKTKIWKINSFSEMAGISRNTNFGFNRTVKIKRVSYL